MALIHVTSKHHHHHHYHRHQNNMFSFPHRWKSSHSKNFVIYATMYITTSSQYRRVNASDSRCGSWYIEIKSSRSSTSSVHICMYMSFDLAHYYYYYLSSRHRRVEFRSPSAFEFHHDRPDTDALCKNDRKTWRSHQKLHRSDKFIYPYFWPRDQRPRGRDTRW